MKKIIFLIMTMLVFTSCLTKVNVDNKGDLNLSIKWPESSDSKSASKALLPNTDKILITIYTEAGGNFVEYSQEITGISAGNTYSAEFKDLTVGNWWINIECKDATGAFISSYSDSVNITNDAPTYMTHIFGSPNKIYSVSSSSSIPDGGVGTISGQTSLAVDVSQTDNTNSTAYALDTATFYVSEQSDFSTLVSGTPFVRDISGITSMGTASATVIASVSPPDITVQSGKTYYWKVKIKNSIGATESSVFSFTVQ